jgi:hypothetical protein
VWNARCQTTKPAYAPAPNWKDCKKTAKIGVLPQNSQNLHDFTQKWASSADKKKEKNLANRA